MKRLFLTVVAVLSMTATFAENKEMNKVVNANSYNMSVNYDKLAAWLRLTTDQTELVQDVHTSFCADMLNASQAEGEQREAMVKTAISKDLKYMRSVLDKEQYRKYLLLLNTTFNNRGLNK